MNSEDLAHLLDARGFAVRTGHHCAQPLLKRLELQELCDITVLLQHS